MPRDTARPPEHVQETAWRQRLLSVLPALTAVLCTAALALGLVVFGRPASASASASEIVRALPSAPPVSAWPGAGQAAMAVEGGGTYASPGQEPVPTASTAKLMTAYVFLSRHPLEPGQAGPSFIVSADEAARYPARLAASESVVPLWPGQHMTERQALEALLATSANNVADELARWYGSDPVGPVGPAGFVAEMNRTAHRLGMDATHYTDPSGLHTTNVTTAADQVRLLQAALRLPDFAILAGSSYTDVEGNHRANTNPVLGSDGVFAGKTGTTTAAGHNLVFAARRDTTAGSRVVVGAVLHQPDAATLTAAVRHVIAGSLVTAPVVHKDEVLAWARDGWGRSVALHAEHDLLVTGPPGSSAILAVEPGPPPAAGTPAGATAARAVVTGLRPTDESPVGDDGFGAPATGESHREGEQTGEKAGVALLTGTPLPRIPPLTWLPLRPLAWLAEAVAP
ncbi:serine hydrolase [Streptomyces erythrochromogenes]|uniref:D-alanyl-D-alanine carboxypeptidase family protein n=1 Tax=Streptomyces erythrochromogenes TaxID=285574 RepID=UPI00343C454F